MPTEESAARRRLTAPLRLDRYILTEVMGPFLAGTLLFLFVFLMGQGLRLADFFIIHGVTGFTLAKLVSLLTLSFLPLTMPLAFLISVLIAFGRLSSDSELVAMKSCGMSVPRLSIPVAGFALVVVLLSIGLNMEWCPWGERAFKSLLIKVSNTKVVASIKEGTFTSGFFDLLIFADKVDTRTNRLSRVFIYDEREPKNPLTVVAREGEIVPVKTASELGAAALLKLYDGSIHRNDTEGNVYQKIDFGEYKLYLKIDEGSDAASQKPEMISYRDLMSRIAKSDANSYEGREWRGEFWRRISIALAPLIFVFLGIGFGTFRTRAVRAGAALVALLTLFAYWGIQTAGNLYMQKGDLSPFVAMNLPNFVMIAIAAYSYRKALW